MTPRHAAAAVAALCGVALVVAIGAAALVRRIDPRYAAVPEDTFVPLRVRKLDAHEHLAPGTASMAVQVARVQGIETLVNLSGGASERGLEAHLEEAKEQRGHVLVFMNLDFEACCDDAWAARESVRLARGKALGARGLAVGNELGLGLFDVAAARGGSSLREARLPVDTARLDRVWQACADLQLPVVVEAGAPKALFERGADVEREDGLATPRWSYADRDRFPPWQDVFDEWIKLVERHPRVTFVGARFGNDAEDPSTVARWMDRLPNLWVDLGGSVPELGRRADATRQAILGHPDRVLFGTDVRYVTSDDRQGIVLGTGQPILLDTRLLGGRDRRVFFDGISRFLETRDPRIHSPTAVGREPDVSGIGLPRAVLERVYRRNAERLLHVGTGENRG